MFYQYDFYPLERKIAEDNFIELLDKNTELNKKIDSFMSNVVKVLYDNLNNKKNIDSNEFSIPDINKEIKETIQQYSNLIKSDFNINNNCICLIFKYFLKVLNEKEISRSEFEIIHEYIYAWLQKKLAIYISEDSRFNSLVILKALLEKTDNFNKFYRYLIENIPNEWVDENSKEWIEVNADLETIVYSASLHDDMKIKDYIKSIENSSNKTLYEQAQKIVEASNYMILSDEIQFKSAVLIRKNISLWIKFLNNLKHPTLQHCALRTFFKDEQYLHAIKILKKTQTSCDCNIKVLLILIAQDYFETSCKFTERLSFYEDSERKNDKNKVIFDKGLNEYKEWINKREKNYVALIELLKDLLENTEIEEWIFNYAHRDERGGFKSNKIYNCELKLLLQAYSSKGNISFKFHKNLFNLKLFNFYVNCIMQNPDLVSITKELLDSLITFIQSEEFYWDSTYIEPYMTSLHGLGFLISCQDEPFNKAEALLKAFKVHHQGWNPVGIDYTKLCKEAFVVSGIILMLENKDIFSSDKEQEAFLEKYINYILFQDKCSQLDDSKDYESVLYLICLVVNQLVIGSKEYYEKELILKYDNLFALLDIFTRTGYELSVNSKELIKTRLDKDFDFEKKKYNNRSQKNELRELDLMVKNLSL